METTKTKQIAWFQWLRIFAAAAVVLMHTAADGWYDVPRDSSQWLALTYWDSLVRWPVPVFVMITGAIFLPRQTELKTVLTRYIPRMVAAFAFWSAVYAFCGWRRGEAEPVRSFLAGHYHMWYLPFLCGVYLILPFLQRIVTDDRLTRQLLAAGLIFGVGIPWAADLAALLWPNRAELVRILENHVNYTFFLDLLSVLVLGHVLQRTELSPRARRCIYILGLLGVVLMGPATVWASARAGACSSLFFDQAAPGTLCTAAAIFVFAKHHLHTLPKLADRLAKWSFGIYLVHPLIIELLADAGLDVLAHGSVWWTPVLAALVFTLSAAVTAVLSGIPAVGKYLV